MSTVDASAGVHPHGAGENYLIAERGLMSWLFTLDHKRIGVMYTAGITTFFLIGGLFALLIRTTLLWPQKSADALITHDLYNIIFTLHGAIMVFLVIIPGIPASIGNFVLPLMLGAKDVAFPKLNLTSWWLWLIGMVLFLGAIIFGGIDTGWTFYTPYSTDPSSSEVTGAWGVIPALFGAFVLGFSSIFTGVNFIVTIHKLRPPTMSWFQLPLLLWALYATAVIQVLATPVLGITLLLLFVERIAGIGIFAPAMGGDPILYQHMFWFYSHPAVYIMILPAFGVISEVISVFSRKHIFGYKFIAFSSIAIALFGFLVWGHHMFTSGQSNTVAVVFSFLTFSVSIPSAIKVFNWLATMYGGSISLKVPMVYCLGFLWIFGIGGLTGLFLGTLSTDVHLHDTYFVVAHFHFVMAGTIFVFFAALYYWWPKFTGRMYHEAGAQWGAWLSMIGFNITFLTQFVLGSHGMPRRYYNYAGIDEFWPMAQTLHVASTVGAYIQAIGFAIAVIVLIHAIFRGAKAPSNPFGGATMDWRTSSPPPQHNFVEAPPVTDPYDFNQLEYDAEEDGYKFKEGYVSRPAH